MRKIISLICFLLPVLAFVAEPVVFAAEPENRPDVSLNIRSDAPDQHIVVKGDTLWDISSKFFKDPWKWPHIWGLNKDSIKDPHWIYPGDVIFLDRNNGTLRIGQSDTGGAVNKDETNTDETKAASGTSDVNTASDVNTTSGVDTASGVDRLSPRVRDIRGLHDAIPSIPAKDIVPFLSQPLIVDDSDFKDSPSLLGAREGRVLLANNDLGFVKGMPSDKGDKWQIYRPGKTFVDPDTDEVLGIEAVYLGNAEVTNFAEVSTVAISHAVQEIRAGDYLIVPSNEEVSAYLPRAPESNISARVISVYGGVSQAGQNAVITLNKGARDGLEVGHVLALYHKGEIIKQKSKSFFRWNEDYALPDDRYGLIFVFRVFNKISYALVMQTKLPVQLLDRASTP